MQRLAYGTWLVMEARNVERERLHDRVLQGAVRDLAGVWPVGSVVECGRVADDGPTHAVAGPQGHLTLHAFPVAGGLVITAFAVGAAPVARFVERAEKVFDLGVYELQSSRFGVLWPRQPEVLERLLPGERFVARARLVPTLD